MADKTTIQGSCHCGDVRFEFDADLTAPTGKCNCTHCAKTRNWSMGGKPADLRVTAGADQLGDYQFNTKQIHWHFCKRCGVQTHGVGDIPELGGAFVSVSVMTLDLTPERLAQLVVRTSDG